MFKKKYRKKLNRKYKRKYKKKIRGRGFVDGFKLLYSFGSQCNEAQKELCNGKTASAKMSDFNQR